MKLNLPAIGFAVLAIIIFFFSRKNRSLFEIKAQLESQKLREKLQSLQGGGDAIIQKRIKAQLDYNNAVLKYESIRDARLKGKSTKNNPK